MICTVRKLDINIVNVVASFTLDTQLDRKKICNMFKQDLGCSATFNRNAIVLRTEDIKMTFLIYQTGSVICVGTKTIEDAEKSGSYLQRLFMKVGLNVELSSDIKINNIVATVNLKTPLNLDTISSLQNVVYEPEQYPSAIYKLTISDKTNIAILITNTGFLYCTGAQKIDDISFAINRLIKDLKSIGCI